jgi:LCP family protein required for cell wall assembly
MSDGRSWYPGESDPRYDDPDAPQQPPAGYGGRGQGSGGDQGRAPGHGPGQRQGQGQGRGQGQDPGRQDGQGRGSGYGQQGSGRPQGPGRGSGFGQSPGYGPQRPGPGQSAAGQRRAPGYDEGYPPGYGEERARGRGDGPGYGDGRGSGRGDEYGEGRSSGRADGYGEDRAAGRGEGRQPGYGGGQGRGFEQGPPSRGREYPEGSRRGGHSSPPLDEDQGKNDVWQAPGDDDPGATDVIDAGESRVRRRRGAAAGTGPGRQTNASTGPSHVNEDIDLDEVDPNGRAQRAWAKQQAAANRAKSRTKAAAKWTSIGVCLVLLAVGGFGVYVYQTTVGSIKHTALLPKGMTEAALPPDPYGNTAQNILLIGSDTRDSSTDCSLGGDCSKSDSADNVGANADSEMILHVSAEGTNATMLSIPRDTVVSLPNCSETGGVTSLTGSSSDYQINSALQYGPECQVAAVHALTGITITGYIMFDFGGVVSMSDALGGVPVCVTAAVDDKNSGLKLPAGTSTISGDQALEFLRTRDSFFDGSDLGREEATHYFLGQLIQTLRKTTNLSDLGELISIGQAAAKATTVSNNYAGLSNLEGLVESLDKVPTNSIAMLTMPWEYDPNNQSRVIPSSAAAAVFTDIQSDTSFSSNAASGTGQSTAGAKTTAASSPSPAASTAAASTVDDSQVPVNIYNADGVVGRAGAVQQALATDGFTDSVSAGNAQTVSTSQVTYDPNQASQADADAVAKALGISTSQVTATTSWQGVSVFVGEDFESGAKISLAAAAATPSVNTSGAASAPADSHESFASGSTNECIPVESGNLNMASK